MKMSNSKIQANTNTNPVSIQESKADFKNSNTSKLLGRSVNELGNENTNVIKNKITEPSKGGIKKIGLLAIGAIATGGAAFIAYRFFKTSSPNPDPSLKLPHKPSDQQEKTFRPSGLFKK